jgi:hypothetical protein
MKKLLIFLFLSNFVYLYSQDMPKLPQELIDLGLDFIENPSDLFFNLQQDIEDCSPLPAGQLNLPKKYFGLRINVLPTLLPLTFGNISIKARFNKEKDYIPQTGIIGGLGKILILDLIKNLTKDEDVEIPEPQNNVYYYGLIISKTFENTILYFGIKYSEFLLKVKLPEPVEFYGSTLEEINFKAADTFLLTGIMLPVRKDKSIIAQMAYGLEYKKIVARLSTEYNHLQLGIDIFPEGLLVLHPYIAYRWQF